jgi:hypothetical protein
MHSTQPKNPQQLGGKKKQKKKNISNTKKGTPSTKKTLKGDTKEEWKSWFPYTIFGEDHPTHQCPWKDEIHRFSA